LLFAIEGKKQGKLMFFEKMQKTAPKAFRAGSQDA
jgi:hypothetical protein